MDKTLPIIITIGLIAILIAPSPELVQPARADDCGVLNGTMSSSSSSHCDELLDHCLNQNSGLVDLDGDHLADDVEVCFLGTDPLVADTDGDGIDDGYDATPELDEMQPLKLRVWRIQQIFPGGGVCDDGSTWDLYFSVINLELPNMGLVTDFGYDGWTLASHGHDYSQLNPITINDDVTDVDGGSASGSNVELELDPDLTSWDGLNAMVLRLDGALTLADHDGPDHYPNGHDDFMDLSFDGENILKINQPKWDFDTGLAHDKDSETMDCQARITFRTDLVGLDANVLAPADALMTTSGMVNCANALVYGCDIEAARQAWSQ